MEIILIAAAYFTIGFLSGAAITVYGALYMSKRYLNKSSKDKAPSADTVSDRLKKVKELTNQQLNLQSQAEIPQKNGLDGRYKNGLIKEVKRLEEEKTEILKSIITDGFDPSITTLDESGEVKQMKLSEFMANMGITMPKSETEKKLDQALDNVRKFTVHRGGKDDEDGGNEGEGETTH